MPARCARISHDADARFSGGAPRTVGWGARFRAAVVTQVLPPVRARRSRTDAARGGEAAFSMNREVRARVSGAPANGEVRDGAQRIALHQ